MKMWRSIVLTIGLAALLTACGSKATANEGSAAESTGIGASESAGEAAESAGPELTYLSDNYADALSVYAQTAVGTLLLEETELAIDEQLAEELLPLWRALQALVSSETTSRLEIDAVLEQIQETMSPDQVSAIAEMKLTEERLQSMLEAGELNLGFGGFGAFEGEEASGGGESGAFGEGFRGGAPAGGFPGGGAGGGPGGEPGGGPGGFAGGFEGAADPDAIATRQAQFAGSGLLTAQERMMTQAVIRLMERKTGEMAADRPGMSIGAVIELVSEATGLSVEEIQDRTQEGETLAEIVEASGGDLDQVRQALVEELSALPNASELDLEQLADQWLGTGE